MKLFSTHSLTIENDFFDYIFEGLLIRIYLIFLNYRNYTHQETIHNYILFKIIVF